MTQKVRTIEEIFSSHETLALLESSDDEMDTADFSPVDDHQQTWEEEIWDAQN